MVGGGARSAFWAQLHADILNIELTVPGGGVHGGALGAARLGWLATGGMVTDVCLPPPVERVYRPAPARHERLMERYERWQKLYRSVRELFPCKTSAAV